jgi:acyl-coenzyme A thioesterase PaaI-like protein
VPDSVFDPLGDGRFLPTDAARGPWTPEALHGGPVAALLAGHAEAVGAAHAPGPMLPVRFTLELFRPIPMAPLRCRAEMLRDGRKVQWVTADVSDDDGQTLAAATLLRMRAEAIDVPAPPDGPPPPPPAGGLPLAPMPDAPEYPAFHNFGVEHRFVVGQFNEPGPATDWIRLRLPLLPGQEPTPLERAVAAADFGNGVSATAFFRDLTFVNADLSVHLHRPPTGEWVCLDSVSHLGRQGAGLAESVLYDETGPIGRSVQSLFVDR